MVLCLPQKQTYTITTMIRLNLLTLITAVLLGGNLFSAQVTQYLKLAVTENSNVTVQQPFAMTFAFSIVGTDGLDANDNGNQYSINTSGNDVFPFSLSSNNDIITLNDARPDLEGYKRIRIGFLSKFPAEIKVLASAFGNTPGDSTNRPTYAWIEQISTGYIYMFFGDTVKINIPENLDFTADFYLHTGPFIKTGHTNETCFQSFDGDVSVINPNCNKWNLSIYKNSVLILCDSVFQPDTTIGNLSAGNYILITSVNSIPVDSTNLIITSAPQIIADFTIDNYTPLVNEQVSFTNVSVGTVTYFWTFGDGGTDTQEHTAHQYENAGVYEVVLVITNEFGCQHSVFDSVYVSPGAPMANQAPNFDQLFENNNNAVYANATDSRTPGFEIYSTDAQRIIVAQTASEVMNITIINVSGQVISTTETHESKIALDVPATGIYIVRVVNAKSDVELKTIMVTN